MQLNLLNTFVISVKMKVNLGKSKIVVLRKNKRKSLVMKEKLGDIVRWLEGEGGGASPPGGEFMRLGTPRPVFCVDFDSGWWSAI